MHKVSLEEKAWKQKLTSQQYLVLRKKQSDPAYFGEMWKEKGEGVYACAGCKTPLFSSEKKYDPGTGWPSFREPLSPDLILLKEDVGFFTRRIEVCCACCEGHLGHLFKDSMKSDLKRYSLNESALLFFPKEKKSQEDGV